MPALQHRIEPADIAPADIYARERAQRRRALIEVKRNRRVEIGPFLTLYFENYDTMLAQVQEMLHIEKGGVEQIEGELAAYNPLIPQGDELIATLMIEIDEPNRRASALRKLAGIENGIELTIGEKKIRAASIGDDGRTDEDGKTSSVHWVRFKFPAGAIADFKALGKPAILAVIHPEYGHMAVLPAATRAELAKDFA